MHLVSVLRDLITCRLEQITDGGNDDSAASLNNPKLIDLHSNVINLLTNMPSTCYEELLSPLNPLPSNVSTVSNSSNAPLTSNIENQPTTNYYLNVRMAHNRKRISRRSKRMKQKQQQKQQQQLDEMKIKQQNIEDLTLAIGIYLSYLMNELI